MKRISIALLLFMIVSCGPRGCVESQFSLAPESRIPVWFDLPAGTSRSQVSVILTYYTPPSTHIDNAVFKLVDRNGSKLAEVSGVVCTHPATLRKPKNEWGGFDPNAPGAFPRYNYIHINNVTEVIEHEHGPIFKIVNDPALIEEALNAKACDRG